MPRSLVRSENTQAITGQPGLRPDIIVTAPGRSAVVLEAEYMPARTVEPEAKSRLGLDVASNGRIIESANALRYAEDVGEAHDLRAALSSARIDYCVFTESAEGVQRFPKSGWLEGGVEDLADMVRLVSVPQRAVDQAAATLEAGIEGAAKLLDELSETRAGITLAIALRLGMVNMPQTRRMACAIIANALVFHAHIAGMHPEIKPLAQVCGDGVDNPQGEVLAAWDDILSINYWAIFAIAKDILEQLPSGDAADILRRLRHTAQSVNATGVDNAHDLTGRIFQRLIADRKYLATFLHAAGVRRASGPAGRRQDGECGLVGRRGHRQAAHRRLCLRDRRAALGGVRAGGSPPRAGRGRPCCAPQDYDGGGALRLRRHALRCPHHRLDPLRRGAVRPLQQLPSVQRALWQDEGRQREDRLPGSVAIL